MTIQLYNCAQRSHSVYCIKCLHVVGILRCSSVKSLSCGCLQTVVCVCVCVCVSVRANTRFANELGRIIGRFPHYNPLFDHLSIPTTWRRVTYNFTQYGYVCRR